jgi:dihydrolipoamide dehydrogenase
MADPGYDLAVLGGGPGGYVAAIRGAQLGMKVVCVERERPGGICLNWGCIPTKALIKSAEMARAIQHAADYGLAVEKLTVDWKAVVARSRKAADQLAGGVEFLFKKHKIALVRGQGTLAGRGKIDVVGGDGARQAVTAQRVILATGARARALSWLQPDGKRIVTYREAMVLPEQPKRIVIVGAGAIGVEFAYIFNALGTKVTLVEALPRVLPIEDAEISEALARALGKQGIAVLVGAKVESVEARKGDVAVTVAPAQGEKQTVVADLVLSAVGVAANVEGIGLEGMGVKLTDRKFIQIDERYRTTSPGIWAIGDCTGGAMLAHKAMQEGIVCVETMLGKAHHQVDYGAIPSCTYCVPEVASVGLTEQAARDAGHEVRVGRFPYSALGKAVAAGYKEGFVKVVVGAHGEILGAHLLGAGATDLIAELGLARTAELTTDEILATTHAHPTLAEAVQEAVAAALGEAIHL